MKKLFILVASLSLTSAENAAIEDFTKANNLFAQSVYKKVAEDEEGNFMVSPFSAETVLAFAHSGCKGESAEELRNALYLPNDKDKVESAVKTLLPKFKDNGLYTLHTANKMYVMKKFPIREEFKNAASLVYQAASESINFTKKVEAAKTMNDWVEKQTNNKIKNLISSEDLNEWTRAVLINALYFKANWSNPFLLASTRKKKFFTSGEKNVEVDTLHHDDVYLKYYESSELKAQFLELPFLGDEASMVIVLPDERDGLASLEKQLDQVFDIQSKMNTEFLNVDLPKFKMESSIDFNEVLGKLGVKKVFDENEADLSGIAGSKGDLVISKVAQKTFIDVTEEGVEAAAATYVLIYHTTSVHIGAYKSFVVDHPFIFYIKVKDLIIFVGRVLDPSKH